MEYNWYLFSQSEVQITAPMCRDSIPTRHVTIISHSDVPFKILSLTIMVMVL